MIEVVKKLPQFFLPSRHNIDKLVKSTSSYTNFHEAIKTLFRFLTEYGLYSLEIESRYIFFMIF